MTISVKYVMTIAWTMMKEFTSRNANMSTANKRSFFSQFLKKAWAQAKSEAEVSEIANTELTGSEKQIGWANDIRRNFVIDMMSRVNKNVSRSTAVTQLSAIVNKVTESKFWIENRTCLMGALQKI